MDKNSQLEDMLMQLRNSMDQFEKSKIKEVQVLR